MFPTVLASKEEGRLPVRVYLTLPHDELKLETSLNDATMESDPEAGGLRDSKGSTLAVQDNGETNLDKTNVADQSISAASRRSRPWSGDQGLVSWNRVKLFSDGSLGAYATCMLDLHNSPGQYGSCYFGIACGNDWWQWLLFYLVAAIGSIRERFGSNGLSRAPGIHVVCYGCSA